MNNNNKQYNAPVGNFIPFQTIFQLIQSDVYKDIGSGHYDIAIASSKNNLFQGKLVTVKANFSEANVFSSDEIYNLSSDGTAAHESSLGLCRHFLVPGNKLTSLKVINKSNNKSATYTVSTMLYPEIYDVYADKNTYDADLKKFIDETINPSKREFALINLSDGSNRISSNKLEYLNYVNWLGDFKTQKSQVLPNHKLGIYSNRGHQSKLNYKLLENDDFQYCLIARRSELENNIKSDNFASGMCIVRLIPPHLADKVKSMKKPVHSYYGSRNYPY